MFPRSTLVDSYKQTAKARAELAIALHNGDESEMLTAAKAAMETSAGLVDIVGEAIVSDDPSTDMALVFSEHQPDGVVVPLSWIAQMERTVPAGSPFTVIRISKDMVDALQEVL